MRIRRTLAQNRARERHDPSEHVLHSSRVEKDNHDEFISEMKKVYMSYYFPDENILFIFTVAFTIVTRLGALAYCAMYIRGMGRIVARLQKGATLSHKAHNKLMHALHGNGKKGMTTPKSKSVHTRSKGPVPGQDKGQPETTAPVTTTPAASPRDTSLDSAPAWFVSHKEHNRLMHALHGNGSTGLVKRLYLNGAPELKGKNITLEEFLSWRIDEDEAFGKHLVHH